MKRLGSALTHSCRSISEGIGVLAKGHPQGLKVCVLQKKGARKGGKKTRGLGSTEKWTFRGDPRFPRSTDVGGRKGDFVWGITRSSDYDRMSPMVKRRASREGNSGIFKKTGRGASPSNCLIPLEARRRPKLKVSQYDP